METGTMKVDVAKKTVAIAHKTKTADGYVEITTTFDLSKMPMERLLKRAADAELIRWRASVGIKEMPTKEALAKLSNVTVDCSAVVAKVKSAEMDATKELVKALVGKGMSMADIMKAVEALNQK